MMQDLLFQWYQQVSWAAREVSAAAPGTPLTQAMVVAVVAWLLSYHLINKQRFHLPPGPNPLPLLGNLLLMTSKEEQFYVTVSRWAKEKYGPVISVYFGPKLCVFINDLDTINEAFIKRGKDFMGRPYIHSLEVTSEGYKDIAFSDSSPTWKLQRKIALAAMRHCMTGAHLERVVHEVMAKAADRMAAEPGPFDPHAYTSKIMFHIIDSICFGKSRPFDDPALERLVQVFDGVNREIGNGFYEDIVPFLKYWPTKTFRKVMSLINELMDHINENLDKCRQRFDPHNVSNMADSILLAMMEAEKENSGEVMATFTDVHVRQILNNMFGAGVDTSRLTLDWVLLFMAGHPEIQKQAQAEIDAVTGTEMPGLEHLGHLPYTQAVLWETMRMSPVVPLALPHKTLCNTSVGGYDVPKDTMVMANIWAVTHDPKLWDQPDQFRPERFLDDEGHVKPLPKAWLPFSAGGRRCIGESVAKPELLLIGSSLLKLFSISLPEGATYDTCSVVGAMAIHEPKTFKIVVTVR